MGLIPGLGAPLAGVVARGIVLVGRKNFDVAGSTGTSNISLTDLTGGLGISAPDEGDVVLLSYATANSFINGDINLSVTGYTELCDLYSADNNATSLGVYLKTMTSTPDTQVTLSSSTLTTNRKVGCISVWRGVDPTTPQDATATTATGLNTMAANPPSITPARAGAMVIVFAAGSHTGGAQSYNSSDLSDFGQVNGDASGFDTTAAMGFVGPWVSGAVNPAVFTMNNGDGAANSWCACCVALRPAA